MNTCFCLKIIVMRLILKQSKPTDIRYTVKCKFFPSCTSSGAKNRLMSQTPRFINSC